MKAYCFLKVGKYVECKEVLTEFKALKQTEAHTVKYLSEIYTFFGENENAGILLENVKAMHVGKLEPNKKKDIDINEQI
jgi:hypothetical protein